MDRNMVTFSTKIYIFIFKLLNNKKQEMKNISLMSRFWKDGINTPSHLII